MVFLRLVVSVVRTARRGRCSFKMWPRQDLGGDPCEKAMPVPEPCRGAAWAGKGSRSLVLCVAAIKLGLYSSTVLVPSRRCKGLILPSFPQPNTSPVPPAGPLGQEGRGCRAQAEFVPWGRHSQSPASLRGEQARHEKVLEDPRELPEPHGREFPRMDRPHSRALASGESGIPQHPSPLRTGGPGARLQQRDLGSRGRQRGRTRGCLRKV